MAVPASSMAATATDAREESVGFIENSRRKKKDGD
jgi:hypothetical protein